jgi:hypothetical protein
VADVEKRTMRWKAIVYRWSGWWIQPWLIIELEGEKIKL